MTTEGTRVTFICSACGKSFYESHLCVEHPVTINTTFVKDHYGMGQDEFFPTILWRVLAPDGSLWCEATDDEDKAKQHLRPGDILQRMYETAPRTVWRREEVINRTKRYKIGHVGTYGYKNGRVGQFWT